MHNVNSNTLHETDDGFDFDSYKSELQSTRRLCFSRTYPVGYEVGNIVPRYRVLDIVLVRTYGRERDKLAVQQHTLLSVIVNKTLENN